MSRPQALDGWTEAGRSTKTDEGEETESVDCIYGMVVWPVKEPMPCEAQELADVHKNPK